MQHSYEMPFGPTINDDGSIDFRLWAPTAKSVDLIVYGSSTGSAIEEDRPMDAAKDGWYLVKSDKAKVGSRYHFRIDGDLKVPDPASRFQPEDVHGPSEVIDPKRFKWTATDWKGRPWSQAAIYEMHVGAFTPEGTYEALTEKLDYLVDLGITAIELMPLSDFPGNFNWGYDGVLPYAPDSSYGSPDELKRLIDEAHQRGLQVFLDVVYNHFGPEGNYLHVYAKKFFNQKYATPWGSAINYDGDGSQYVRDFVRHNVLYWLEEYRFDGLRFDAVDTIYDYSRRHILNEIAQAVNSGPGADRHIHIVLENGNNDSNLITGGGGREDRFTAQWNDDIHHSLHVIATGETSGYYADFCDEHSDSAAIEHLGRCLSEGFTYQGQHSTYFGEKSRGSKSKHLPPSAFICFIQNHDQIGNRAFGERISHLTDADCVQALSAIILLNPAPPMIFMGDEWAASTLFTWFAHFEGDLGESVRKGRLKEFSRFDDFKDPKNFEKILDPTSAETFKATKLNWDDLQDEVHAQWLEYHKQLLSLRKNAIVPIVEEIEPALTSWTILEEGLLEVRWPLKQGGELKLLANLSDQGATSPLFSESDFDERNILFQTPLNAATEIALGTVPPWSVIWLLERSPISA